MNKNTKWGGSRSGAGRPKEESTKKTIVVRVAEDLLPTINILKAKHKTGETVEHLLNITDNQEVTLQAELQVLNDLVEFQNNKIYELNKQPLAKKNDELLIRNNDFIVKYNKEHARAESLKAELERFKKTNLELVLQKDAEHLKAVKFETKTKVLRSDITGLEKSINTLLDKKYNCMALKKDGNRCTRPAKTKINWHGVEINACLQHSKVN
ncbi:MAG: hypothetical protein KAJ63_06585 [Methyloprofundus sp.]|nr:hypothetical protein [Methyloprofundus sp.]